MHMEERHRAVRHVIGAELVKGGDRPRRGREVSLPERHLLGPARRAARVKEQGDVVGLRRLERRHGREFLPGIEKRPARLAGANLDRAYVPRRLVCGLQVVGRDDQELGLQVIEVELVLVAFVAGIEGCSRGTQRDEGKQDEQEVGAVREHERDATPASHTNRGEPSGECRCYLAELEVAECVSGLGAHQRRPAVLADTQQIREPPYSRVAHRASTRGTV